MTTSISPDQLPVAAGTVSTTIFVASLLPMMWRAIRTRDLSSYSTGHLVLGNAAYRMPIAGLYLCGSGAHPGGGVTGIPGRNAAREIVRDARRRRHRGPRS